MKVNEFFLSDKPKKFDFNVEFKNWFLSEDVEYVPGITASRRVGHTRNDTYLHRNLKTNIFTIRELLSFLKDSFEKEVANKNVFMKDSENIFYVVLENRIVVAIVDWDRANLVWHLKGSGYNCTTYREHPFLFSLDPVELIEKIKNI